MKREPINLADRSSRRGFSLVQMAGLLMVVGVIISTVVPALMSRIQKDKAQLGLQTIRSVRDEIIGFAITNSTHYLPQTLSSLSVSTDPWGNSWKYIVAHNNATGTSLSASDVSSATHTDLQVKDRSIQTVSDVAFIIISYGPNLLMDANYDGLVYPGNTGTVTLYSPGQRYTNGTNDDQVEIVTLSYLKSKL